MVTHIKGMTKIVAISATAGSIAVQVTFDGTNFYTVESVTTTNG